MIYRKVKYRLEIIFNEIAIDGEYLYYNINLCTFAMFSIFYRVFDYYRF